MTIVHVSLIIAVISILASITTSLYVFLKQHKRQRQVTTLEYLHTLLSDEKLLHANNHFINNTSLKDYDNSSAECKQKKIEIRLVLNYFEQLSMGVKLGLYDIKIVKESRRSQIISVFSHSESYISHIRKSLDNPNLFKNLEWLVKKLAR